MNRRLAIWVFGPIGCGKTHVLSRLSLAQFHRVEQDLVLEREMEAAGIPFATHLHTVEQQRAFVELREHAARMVWDPVPGLLAQGRNLAFETTGNKPHLFGTQIELGHAHGYTSLGCAIRRPLEACMASNLARRRVLPTTVVEATWRDFEKNLTDGTYGELFNEDRLEVFSDALEAIALANAWIAERLGEDFDA